jgi:hypothetical protein
MPRLVRNRTMAGQPKVAAAMNGFLSNKSALWAPSSQ